MSFHVEIDPEFPGDGDWGCPVVGFDRDGTAMEAFDSRWGPPFLVRIVPTDGEAWVALFAAGGLGSLRGAYASPDPHTLVVVADGLAYLVDARAPTRTARPVHAQAHQVVPSADPPLLLVVGFVDMVAIGPDGVAWATPRLCLDGLRVVRTDHSAIECSCDDLDGGTSNITLDPDTGARLAP